MLAPGSGYCDETKLVLKRCGWVAVRNVNFLTAEWTGISGFAP
jgi:hypothetical protein